jgi:chromosome partitioning protein
MIIAFTGQKGGVGKSTTAICVAACAVELGHRALLVDADPQGTARTWGEVAQESGRPSATVVAMGASMHRPGQLRQLASSYDITIIDCPPRHGDIQRSALMVADIAVLPSGPSATDAWALAGTLDVIREAQVLRDELRACILITRKQGRTALGQGAREVLGTSGLPVLESELGYRIAYQEAIAAGLGVTTFSPRDRAAAEIRALYDELERFHHGKEISGCYITQAATG